MIITSKHHDGFTLWPSEEANKSWGFPWNAKDVGSKRDFKTAKNTKVSLLGSDVKLDFKQVGTDLVISVPYLTPDELPANYAYAFKITNVIND